jgi:hypothetical protein
MKVLDHRSSCVVKWYFGSEEALNMGKPKEKEDWEKAAELAKIPMADDLDVLNEFESTEAVPEEFIELVFGRSTVVNSAVATFSQLVEIKRIADSMEKIAKTAKDWAGDQLLLALAMSEHDRVRLDAAGTLLKVGNGRSASKIEPTKLLEQGVSVDQIKAATVEGKPYSFAQIVPAGKKGNNDGE